MDCCNYGEYRPYGAGGWDYGPYAPLPYAPYAHYYAPHTQDHYARYYRYDYPTHHMQHAEHVMPMDYGVYASKESRVRRSIARRDQRAHTPAQHLPLPPTPPLECGMNGRGPAYCEPQMWPHYQMGAMGGGASGWNGANAVNGGWAPRTACSREHMRYPAECPRPIKSSHMHAQNQACQQDGRLTPYPVYEDTPFNGESSARQRNTPEFKPNVAQAESTRAVRERIPAAEPRRSPLEEKRPPPTPIVPLPAFQQAFGSTEIGKFAEAFSRTEVVDDAPADGFVYESYPEWDGAVEPQWSSPPAAREIKCEDNF